MLNYVLSMMSPDILRNILFSKLLNDHSFFGYFFRLKFFVKGTKDPIRYRGQRDLVSLTNFIAESIGSAVEMPEEKETESPKGAVELTIDNFKDHVATGDHFVKFYAPWCGHCQVLFKIFVTWNSLSLFYLLNRDWLLLGIIWPSQLNMIRASALPKLIAPNTGPSALILKLKATPPYYGLRMARK